MKGLRRVFNVFLPDNAKIVGIDLTYEGIATVFLTTNSPAFFAIVGIDLTYEGIATNSHCSNVPANNVVGIDLTYEGIATFLYYFVFKIFK